jgi:ubiquinone/menaquinone biosynthesis C-methylase UbiE
MSESNHTSPQKSTYIINAENAAEMARLTRQGQMLTKTIGIFPAGINPTPFHCILDLACGPGEWALAVAEAYPHIQVTGIDIDQLMINYARYLASERTRSNAQFHCASILQTLPFANESFDMINARLLCAFMPPAAWTSLLQECKRLLRPGGIICLTEAERSISNSPAQESLNTIFTKALRRAGLSFSVNDHFIAITPQLRRLLRESGIENIQQQATIIDFSQGEPLHADMIEDLATVFKVAQPFFIKCQVTTQEELDQLYPQLLAELDAPDFCGLWWYLSAWGQKPL